MDTVTQKILIVEDELAPLITSMLGLADDGYEVVSAKTGTAGVRKAKTEQPDLIVMDIKLPVMNGIDAIIEIRKFDKEVPILVITAYPNRMEAAMVAGADTVMQKPINVERLLKRTKQLIQKGRVA